MTLLVGLDIETTGFLDNGDHRIVEVYAGFWDLATRCQVGEYYKRIHPQRSIPIEAQRVHKIALHDLEGCPIWEDVADELVAFIERADLIVAHNGEDFDVPFINQELKRIKKLIVTVPVIDTMKKARWATANGKNPNLGELCFAMGVPYDVSMAHAASYDVAVMMTCFFQGLDWGWFSIGERDAA